MALRPLPHAYPFRFVDQVALERDEAFSRGRVVLRVTANQEASRGLALSPILLSEVIAQSVLLVQGGDPEIGRSGFLAGVEDFSADRAPEPGDTLEVDVALSARFGSVLKFSGSVRCAGTEIARGRIIVREGDRKV